MITHIFSKNARFQRCKLALKRLYANLRVFEFRLKRVVLGLKLAFGFFYLSVFVFKDRKAFLEDYRRAVLVDEFFRQLQHRSVPKK